MTNHFTSGGGTQPIAQGDHAIGQLNNNYGVPYEAYGALAGQLGVTESALASFFKILEQEKVPAGDLDSKLREIAGQYKELLARVGGNQAAKQAIEAGEYAKAEALLEEAANQHSLAAAEAHADNARLQRVQLRYAKAAAYWQKAATLLPEDKQKERAEHLNEAGSDLYRIAKYKEALPLFEQSLRITQEIGDRAGEGTTLNNLAMTAYAKGDYDKALPLWEQSLAITQEIGDRAVEGATLNNISQIYKARGDYATALKYLEQSLAIMQEIGDRRGEAEVSWNIGAMTYKKRKAEPYISRAVQLAEEIGHPKLKEWRKALAAIRAKLRGR